MAWKIKLINLLSGLSATITLILILGDLLINRKPIGNNGLEIVTNFGAILLLSAFIGLMAYIGIKYIWLKFDKSFRDYLKEKFRQHAVAFFQKRRMEDGAYYESLETHPESLASRIFGWFVLGLVVLSGVATILFNALSRGQLTVWMILIASIAVFGFVLYVVRLIKKWPQSSIGPFTQFRLYDDRILLLPEGKIIPFTQLKQIVLRRSYNSSMADILYGEEKHTFNIFVGGLTVEGFEESFSLAPFLEYLGFERYQESPGQTNLPVTIEVYSYARK